MDVNASDEEKAEGIRDRQQEGAPLEKDTVKVRRTFHHIIIHKHELATLTYLEFVKCDVQNI